VNPGIDDPINQTGYIEIPDLSSINDMDIKTFIKKVFFIIEKKNDGNDNRTFIKVPVEATKYKVVINGFFKFDFNR
jgi:hypothetical protein